MRYYVKYFFFWNLYNLIVAIFFTFFKANKGILGKLNKCYLLHPLVSLIFLVVLWRFRLQYESKVCFCDFRESLDRYLKLSHKQGNSELAKKNENLNSYHCLENRDSYDGMLYWETVVSGLFYGLIVLHYYKNVLVIKSRDEPAIRKPASILKDDPMSSDIELSSRLLSVDKNK
jgi:hypothetical protein